MARKVPQVVYDIVDTFNNITADPVLTWPSTIVGTYDTIADTVTKNPNVANTYTRGDIGYGLTWLHKNGASVFGVTVIKVGPGRVSSREMVDGNGTAFTVTGNIYLMVGANQKIDPETWDLIVAGLKAWAEYYIASVENDLTMSNLYSTIVPNNAQGRAAAAALGRIMSYQTVTANAVRDLIAAL